MGTWSAPGQAACRRPHVRESIDTIYCPSCHKLVIFSGMPRNNGRVVRWPIVVIVASYLVAIFLTRHPGAQWFAYTFLALTVLHLFAFMLSRGAILKPAALITLMTVVSWSVWRYYSVHLMKDYPAQLMKDRAEWHSVPVLLWVAAVVYAFFLGSYVVREGYRAFSETYLVAVAFVFGMWALLALNVQYGLGYNWLSDIALFAVAAAPMIVIVVDVLRASGERKVWQDIAALLVAISAYLTVLQLVIEGVIHTLRDLPWRILGLPAEHPAYPDWFTLLLWKEVVSAGILALAVVVIVLTSIDIVAQESPASDFLVTHIKDSTRRLESNPDIASLISEYTLLAGLHASRAIYLFAAFIVEVIDRIMNSIVKALPRACSVLLTAVRRLAIPLACLSASSLLLMAVVRDAVGYGAGQWHAYGAPNLWGGLVCAAILMLALCIVGLFGLSPISMRPAASFKLAIPAALIAGCCCIIITAADVVVLPAVGYTLGRVRHHVTALGFGPLQFTNLCFVLGFLAATLILNYLTGGFSAQNESRRHPAIFNASVIAALFGVGGCALALGYGPIAHWLDAIV